MRIDVVRGACVLVLAASASLTSGVQVPPSTDIWLARLELGSDPPALTGARNVTDRDGYDNQPSFEPEGRALLYTSQRNGQTDIYRLDLESLVASQLSETPESEYSPAVTPSGLEISVVRVEQDGTQRLWSFRRDGSAPRIVLEEVALVGYHAWGGAESLVLFVLGEPPTLQLADTSTGNAEIVASDIGRSLHAIPDNDDYSFLQGTAESRMIRRFAPHSGVLTDIAVPLEGSQDMVWTPDGSILMASGARIFILQPDGEWTLMADLSSEAVSGITRLAISPDGTRLAWVATRE